MEFTKEELLLIKCAITVTIAAGETYAGSQTGYKMFIEREPDLSRKVEKLLNREARR